jgi:uncharacterized membrane protein
MDHLFITALWFFIIYAILGWCIEVTFQTVTKGKFINRGFLNGPVCPIYGFGMIILLYFLSPFTDNLILLFIGSVVLTSVLEFITGFVLEKVFHDKWWDYSDRPFNIKGYICLSFSIMWGLAAVFVIEIVHPPISKFVSILDNNFGNILLVLFISYFIADFLVTIFAILKINKQFRLLEEMADRLRLYSDGIGEEIFDTVSTVVETADKLQKEYHDSKAKLETTVEKDLHISQLKERYEELRKERPFVLKRLEKAYPNIKERLAKYKEDEDLDKPE